MDKSDAHGWAPYRRAPCAILGCIDTALREGEHGDGFDLRGQNTELRLYAREILRHRGLVRVLSRKDFLVRYRRASFGIVWSVAIPALQAAVLALVLPRFLRFETPGSYITYVFGGTTAFSFFANGIVHRRGVRAPALRPGLCRSL